MTVILLNRSICIGPGYLASASQHARMVGCRVVAKQQDGIDMLERIPHHRGLAHADPLRQAACRPQGRRSLPRPLASALCFQADYSTSYSTSYSTGTIIVTRRFSNRPSTVLLSATGLLMPRPRTFRLSGFMPDTTISRATDCARRMDNC